MSGNFEIFISYRRKGGYDIAKLLYDRLRMDGYSVFFDIDVLEKGDFDNELKQRVNNCKDFLLVLSQSVFDRFSDPNCKPEDDWVRQEIVCALREKKNIVPIILDGFEFPQTLPDDVKDISRKNAIDLSPRHFEDTYARMKRVFLLSKPHWATRYKKSIISAALVAFVALFAFAAYLFSSISQASKQKDLELLEARMAVQAAAQKADSIRAAEFERITDSIKNASSQAGQAEQASQQATPKPAEKPHGASGKSLHWAGSNDAIGKIIFSKLSPAGVKKTKCSGDGIAISINKPACKANAVAQIVCSYSPKITLASCSGKTLATKEMSEKFKSSPQQDEAAGYEDLAENLRKSNFTEFISIIKSSK